MNKENILNFYDRYGYNLTMKDLKLGFQEKINITIWSGIFRIHLKGIYNNFALQSIINSQTVNLFIIDIQIDSPALLIINLKPFNFKNFDFV